METAAKKKLTRGIWAAILMIVVAIPATLYLGTRLPNRQYYITSLLLILYAMIPFFLAFEKRRPQARELVVLAVMCAIAVVSRLVFIWVPHFKPMAAIIIIAGVAFGAEAGFLVGAMSALVSQFFFGQGPWTPWQMFAFGMAGFLAGIFHQKGLLPKKRLPLCIFGGVVVIVVVGGILNSCTLFTVVTNINWASASTIYLAGLPVDAIQAAATVLMLLVAAKPMLEKLDRVKTKYGIMEG